MKKSLRSIVKVVKKTMNSKQVCGIEVFPKEDQLQVIIMALKNNMLPHSNYKKLAPKVACRHLLGIIFYRVVEPSKQVVLGF